MRLCCSVNIAGVTLSLILRRRTEFVTDAALTFIRIAAATMANMRRAVTLRAVRIVMRRLLTDVSGAERRRDLCARQILFSGGDVLFSGGSLVCGAPPDMRRTRCMWTRTLCEAKGGDSRSD